MKHDSFIKTIFALTTVAVLSGCVKDEIREVKDKTHSDVDPVTITVTIPGQRIPSATRSIAGGDGEAVVTSIDVLVFKEGVSGEVFAQHVPGESLSQNDSGNDYTVRFTAKLESEPLATTVVILANVPASTISSAITRTDKRNVLDALVYASSNVGGQPDGWKWNASGPGNFTPIPMYGEKPVSGIDEATKIKNLPLTRMLARIDVKNYAKQFTLTDVYVVNYNTAGFIAPAWNAGGELLGSLPAAPMLPDTANPQMGETNAMVYSYPEAGLEGQIYVYEAAAAAGGGGDPTHRDAICLIVKGEFDGATYFYRIDFTSSTDASGKTPGMSQFNPSTVSFMPVYRNYCYIFDILEVNGVGYERFDDALQSLGVTNNMKCSFLLVDETGIFHMVWNGEHFLGAGQKEINVAQEGERDTKLQVSTNYAGGWSASVENPNANTWLTLNKASGHINDKALIYNADAAPNNEWDVRSCTVVLTAGRLQMRIPVTQGNYRIVAETASGYMLDGVTQHGFKVKSNTQWAVRKVSDPNGILLDSHDQIAAMQSRTGGYNTSVGDDFNFKLINDTDGSISGRSFTVTFYDPDGKATDIVVTVTGVTCGNNGIALSMQIGKNTYMTHMYGTGEYKRCWMVQNSREVIEHTSTYVSSTTYGSIKYTENKLANGYFYTWDQAKIANNACPEGWHLPSVEEATVLVNEIRADFKANPDGKSRWWAGSKGASNDAFAGYYSTTAIWYHRGVYGYWWHSSSKNSYDGFETGMNINAGNNQCFSVRCVRE